MFAEMGFWLVWLHEMRYVSGGPTAAIRKLEKLVWRQCTLEVQHNHDRKEKLKYNLEEDLPTRVNMIAVLSHEDGVDVSEGQRVFS
jgi:hypothetical protein